MNGSFFSWRWRGQISTSILLWRDMILVGTLINVAMAFAALMCVTQGLPHMYAAAIYFSPLPYNLFLLICLLRSQRRKSVHSLIASIWFAAVTLF